MDFQELMYKEDVKAIKSLKFNISKEKITLFYPGSASDIATPLLYILTQFKTKKATLIFVDVDHQILGLKNALKTLNVKFKQNNHVLKFNINKIPFTLKFYQYDIHQVPLPKFNVYFEKAFRIMKTDQFEKRIYDKLEPNGILIADNGYKQFKLKKLKAPKKLSAYKDMIIAIKPQV